MRLVKDEIVSIEEAGFEDAYDAKVPVTNNFILENGLLLHNCGTMGEPFLDCDVDLGVTKSFLMMLNNYKFPLFLCTKGNLLFRNEEYYDLLVRLKEYGLVVDVSLISLDDELLKKYEPFAITASERLELIERLSEDGVDVVVSCRPFIAGLTDLGFEDYIRTLCEKGVRSIHIRQFYISGFLAKRWKKWVITHKEIMVRYGVGWKYKFDYLEGWFKKAQEIARKYDVGIVGGSPVSFGESHKIDFQRLSDRTRKALFPYTVNPIHARFVGRKEPKILRYKEELEPMLKTDDPMLEQSIDITRKTIILVYQRCCQIKPRVDTRVNFRTIIRRGIWDGWDFMMTKRLPAIATAYNIKAIVEEDESFSLDEDNHRLYAFLPKTSGKRIERKELIGRGLDV